MSYMFWVWLGVLAATTVLELITQEIVSIWFTLGAVVPFILAATNAVAWWIQVIIFIVVSAAFMLALRPLAKKFFLKGADLRTNTDALIGKKYRMLSRTDFETVGSVKVNDVVWSAIAEERKTVEEGEIVEVVKVDGNKLIVKVADADAA